MESLTNLPINSLDYPDIRNNLISFLNDQRDSNGDLIYQDYNFQASGLSTLLNLLAYHGHYLGYYIKMVLNESFIDSSVRLESLLSKAKLNGYLPKGKTSSRIDIVLSVDVNKTEQPSSRSILLPRGTSFSGMNANSDQRVFWTIEDVFIKNIQDISPTEVRYESDTITIYEGKLEQWDFKIDSSLLNQRLILRDKNIDVDTVKVIVYPDSSTQGEEYFTAKDIFSLDGTSPVYYMSTNEEGYYEFFFGNGVIGKEPKNNSTVRVSYISTHGESGNGCKKFQFNAPQQDIPTEHTIGNWEDFTITISPGDVSSGGVEAENQESLRFTIPHHTKRQNRIVNDSDYRSIIFSEFRNIDSINVWGGENNYRKDYGKIYISIKPKYTDKLTLTAKNDITNRLLKKYCVVGMEPVFIDPEFIDVNVDIYAKIDTRKTTQSLGTIEKNIVEKVVDYNINNLNVFDNFLSDVIMLDSIIESNPFIKSCYSKKKINKKQQIIYASGIENVLFIGNPLEKGIKSSYFLYGGVSCYFGDEDGKIFIFRTDTGNKYIINSVGYVDYKEGLVYYTFPEFARLVDNDFTTSGIISFEMTPENPDIETFFQNIVRITKIRVFLTSL